VQDLLDSDDISLGGVAEQYHIVGVEGDSGYRASWVKLLQDAGVDRTLIRNCFLGCSKPRFRMCYAIIYV
jgi:hypothetical protein